MVTAGFAFGAFVSSRSSASHAAACGAAADVPVNGEPKPPTPLTSTLSAADHVGASEVSVVPATPTHGPAPPPGHCVVMRSCTGPPLEYGSSAPIPAPFTFCASTAAAEVASPV